MLNRKCVLGFILFAVAMLSYSCTLQKDPADVLIASYENQSKIESAVFTYSVVELKGDKYIEDRKKVFVQRDEMHPNAPFKFRIEESNGDRITVFDGKKFVSIDKTAKTAFLVTEEHSPEKYAEQVQRIIAKVMETNDKETALSTIASHRGFKYQGKGEVYGRPCEIIHFSSPAFQMNSEWNVLFYKGINDGFTWMSDTRLYANGIIVQSIKEVLLEVETDIDIDASMFTEAIPSTYKIELAAEKEQQAKEETPELIKVGEMAPDFTLKDQNGNEIKLADLRGNVVMLDFWGTWCAWCIIAMPKIQSIYNSTKDMPFKLYGVSCKESESADPAAFLKSKGASYDILLKGDEVAKLYGVSGFPSIVVIDKDGKIVFSEAGYSENMDIIFIQMIKQLSENNEEQSIQ